MNYFLVHRSSPSFPALLFGLALRSRFPGSQPPPPLVNFWGLSLRSSRWPCCKDFTRSEDASRKCIKLQNPPRLHSPFSFCRQQASLKSVTGDSSAYNGRPIMENMSVANTVCPTHYAHTCIPPVIQIVHSSLGFCLPFVSGIDIANEMVADVVTNLLWIEYSEYDALQYSGRIRT